MNFKLLGRMFIRAGRVGEARLLFASLAIAVAALASVSFFADRVGRALERQASELIGGDLAFSADKPIPEPIVTAAQNVSTAQTVTFPSMSSFKTADGDVLAQLVDIKAITTGFPLRGKIMLSQTQTAIESEQTVAAGIPAPGTIWIAPQLSGKLGVKVGDTLRLGQKEFLVSAIIAKEPDTVLDYFGLAPRVIIAQSDVAATQLLQLGSRVTYKLLMAGDESNIKAVRNAIQPQLARGQRLEGPRDSRSEVRASLDRAGRFLSLASMLSVILAAAAAALAARRFSQRQTDAAALMRCLGASRWEVFTLYLAQVAMLAVCASFVGVMLGYVGQWGLAKLLEGFFTTQLPPPSMEPWLHAFTVGVALFLGFTVPPLVRLQSVPALRVLRRDLAGNDVATWITIAMAAASIGGLIIWRAGDIKIGFIAVGGFSVALLVTALIGFLLVRLVGPLRGVASTIGGGAARYGLANLARRKGLTMLQIGALGLGIMAILILIFVRGDLMNRWQAKLPADAANRFAVNIQPDQLAGVKSYFAERGLSTPDLYPMIRGRLVELNGKKLTAENFADERAKRLSEREFNLTWHRDARTDNPVVEGQWWAADDKTPQISVEVGIAKTLGIQLGDTMTYDIAGTRYSGKVTSVRKLDWDTFKPNFFVVGNPAMLEGQPASYITSFKLPAGQEGVINQLVARFPNVSVIDITAIMNQVKSVSDQVSRAVEFVFLFALASGVLVLYAAIIATQDERAYEGAIMRTLGAARKQLLQMQTAEFLAIGLLAGLVAGIGAYGLGTALSEQLLGEAYRPAWWLWLVGLGAGAGGITLAGLLGTYRTTNTPPLAAIRANS